MARLPNGCIRMLWALLQFGSAVSAVNSPSPPTARTRRSEPRTALSKRFSSESSSTRSWPETITIGAPIMSSQKIGPSSLASRVRCCTGAAESNDSMLPTTGLVGGCGIGLSLFFFGAIKLSVPCLSLRHSGMVRSTSPGISRFSGAQLRTIVRAFARPGMTPSLLRFARNDELTKPPSTPFDQLGADLFRLFLLRPMAAVAHQIFFEIRHQPFHTVGSRRRQHGVVFCHDHQRRNAHVMIEPFGAPPVAGEVAVPIDAAGEAGLPEGVDKHLLFLRRQDRRARIVSGVVIGDH